MACETPQTRTSEADVLRPGRRAVAAWAAKIGVGPTPGLDGMMNDRMEQSLFRYIWTHSKRQQIWILFIVALSMPSYFLAFDIHKQIVN